MRDVCLIVNPSAGGGRGARKLPLVEAALRARGIAFRVERTASLEHARALAHGTLATGEVAAALGGDGLTGAIAGELRDDPRGLLAILPGGRGNDFARKLGIGADPVAACDLLAEGAVRVVDVADVAGRTYLGIASAGLDSDVQVIANSTRLRLGTLVYLYGTLQALRRWKAAEWEVELDGVLTADAPRRECLRNLPKLFSGTHVEHPMVTVLRAREVTFSADRPFAIYADGDPIADLPATIRVRPGALRVLAPAAA